VTEAVAPVTQAVAPVTQAVAPVTEPVAPVTQATAPVTQATAPVTQATAPVTQAVAPVAEAVGGAPGSQASQPVVVAVQPVVDATATVVSGQGSASGPEQVSAVSRSRHSHRSRFAGVSEDGQGGFAGSTAVPSAAASALTLAATQFALPSPSLGFTSVRSQRFSDSLSAWRQTCWLALQLGGLPDLAALAIVEVTLGGRAGAQLLSDQLPFAGSLPVDGLNPTSPGAPEASVDSDAGGRLLSLGGSDARALTFAIIAFALMLLGFASAPARGYSYAGLRGSSRETARLTLASVAILLLLGIGVAWLVS
jgi:hypothetical protein